MDSLSVYVVGAGPAGLFAARKIATAGHQVTIFNRDVRPGGLAEYGIYPMKHHMKAGLRKQFAKILAMPNVEYFGNVPLRCGGPLTCDALRAWNPAAIVYAVGAQGTKKLGMPGENASGVYSAKDFVYHYNGLPPFSSQDFSTGRRVAIVGMGNVMVDIARWLLIDQPGAKPEEVTVIARRGPFEVKFDEKEFDYVERFLNRGMFRDELARVADVVAAAGQDVGTVADSVFPWLKTEPATAAESRLTFRFLTSPIAIEPGPSGRIERLRVVANLLVRQGEDTKARATDKESVLPFDTLIFAIGDVADPTVGLPYGKNEYVTNTDAADPDRASYEVFDPALGKPLDGSFVVGWARKASEGLVGKARFDAERGCDYVLKYLADTTAGVTPAGAEILDELQSTNDAVVTKQGVERLLQAETRQAQGLGLPEFKYPTNQEMLAAILESKEAHCAA
ncbi:MAG TPA: FAD-dependent oxidoreductase [Terriglobia bacterium]|nr:FAD-dependent oxidoreductase [Terriglobia bacterium]